MLESQVVVKKETDLVSVKEETPADKECPNNSLTIEITCKTTNIEEGEKTETSITKSSKQHESQSDTSDHSRDESKDMQGKATESTEQVTLCPRNSVGDDSNVKQSKESGKSESLDDPNAMPPQDKINSEQPVSIFEHCLEDVSQGMKPQEKTDNVEHSNATQEQQPQENTDYVIDLNAAEEQKPQEKTDGVKDLNTAEEQKPQEKTDSVSQDSKVPAQEQQPSEKTYSVDDSNLPVKDLENMESVPSPISVHNTESEGHRESLDEDEAINMDLDDDYTDTIENMQPSDIARVYDTMNRINNFPRYQPNSCQETLMDIVISSVGLMRYLKFRKKLSEADIEEAEDLIKDIHMENTRQKWIKRWGGGSSGVDRTATKSADKVSTQVESQSLTQSEINTQMESSISQHKYINYDLALHVYSEQFYTEYDIFPPTFNTWEGYTPQSHFNRYMGNAPVQNYFHEMAYPSENSHGQMQQKYYDSHLSQQEGNI